MDVYVQKIGANETVILDIYFAYEILKSVYFIIQ